MQGYLAVIPHPAEAEYDLEKIVSSWTLLSFDEAEDLFQDRDDLRDENYGEDDR